MLKWMKAAGSVTTNKTLLKEMGVKFSFFSKLQTIKLIFKILNSFW